MTQTPQPIAMPIVRAAVATQNVGQALLVVSVTMASATVQRGSTEYVAETASPSIRKLVLPSQHLIVYAESFGAIGISWQIEAP